MSVVCDNHHDRPAVASWAIHPFGRVGFRPESATLASTFVDLCEECAAVLGWSPLPPPPEEPLSDPQRRLLFARFGELGFTEDERHELLEDVNGSPSIRDLHSGDVDRVLARLDQEAARRA